MMPKRCEVHFDIRNQVLGLLNGKTRNQRNFSDVFNIPHTVISIRKKWELQGTTKNDRRSGRPKKISEYGTRQLKNILRSNRTTKLDSVTILFNTGKVDKVSSKTVARALHSLGFSARKASRKPMISKRNQKKSLEFILSINVGLI